MTTAHIGKLSKEISTTVTDEFAELLSDRVCLSRCPFQTGKTNLSVASPALSQSETPAVPVAPLACGLGAA